jgi:hypothetical protein
MTSIWSATTSRLCRPGTGLSNRCRGARWGVHRIGGCEQLPFGLLRHEVHENYCKHPSGMGLAFPFMFANVAGAVVLSSASKEHDDPTKGLLSVIGIHGLHRMEDGRTVGFVVVN